MITYRTEQFSILHRHHARSTTYVPFENMHVANVSNAVESFTKPGTFIHYLGVPAEYLFNHQPYFDTSDWVEASVPFSGFYQSWHEQNINDAIEYTLSDGDGTPYMPENKNGPYLVGEAYGAGWEFGKITIPYVKWYVDAVSEKLTELLGERIPLRFSEMTSPREYNFETDRIFAKMPAEAFRKLCFFVSPDEFQRAVRQKFTSRDGFISFYSSDAEDWGPLDEWDYNQRGTVLDALFEGHDVEEYELVEDIDSNGDLSNWVWDALPERVTKIASYLREREDRARINKQLTQMAG